MYRANEKHQIKRAERFCEQYPNANPLFPLIENKLTKQDCLKIVKDAGIELPEMYKLGFSNNNCIGCVKGGMGYWNKIRVDFPETFQRMAALERQRIIERQVARRLADQHPGHGACGLAASRQHDDEIGHEVNQRRRRKRFEHLEGEFLHRAGTAREFEQPDRQCDRRILDDVEKLGGERRQHDAERLRQEHVAV